jgi:HTH-type transcriptional regulator/antitoxin MqsA
VAATETKIHPTTGEVLRRDTRPQTVRYGAVSRVVQVAGWYPEGNGDSIHSGEEVELLNRVYVQLRGAHNQRRGCRTDRV